MNNNSALRAIAAQLEHPESLTPEEIYRLQQELERTAASMSSSAATSRSNSSYSYSNSTSSAAPHRPALRNLPPPTRSESRCSSVNNNNNGGSMTQQEIARDGRENTRTLMVTMDDDRRQGLPSTDAKYFSKVVDISGSTGSGGTQPHQQSSSGNNNNNNSSSGSSPLNNFTRALEHEDKQKLIFIINAQSESLKEEREAKRRVVQECVAPMQVALKDLQHENMRLQQENESLRAALQAMKMADERSQKQHQDDTFRRSSGAVVDQQKRDQLLKTCQRMADDFRLSLQDEEEEVEV